MSINKVFILIVFLPITIFARERIWQPNKISITVDTGKYFKEVTLKLETKNRKIKSIYLNVAGKQVAIPKTAYNDLENPLLSFAEIRTEKSRSGLWLYTVFKIGHRRVSDGKWDPKTVYIAYNGKKIVYRSIRIPITAKKWKREKKSL